MRYEHLIGFMSQLAYITLHAIAGTYKDNAFTGYDKEIRQQVREDGLDKFTMGNQSISLLHFTLENTKTVRETRRANPSSKTFTTPFKNLNRPRGYCYAYNYTKEGCSGEDVCGYVHKCIACHSTNHPFQSCPKRKF